MDIQGTCVHAKLLQLCPTLCDPMDCSPPGSSALGFSRQEYWSGFPWSSPRDLLNPGIEPTAPVAPGLQAGSKMKNKTRISTHTIFIQHRFGSSSSGNHRRKRNKRNSNCKEVKLIVFADAMIL